ncbi:hypothetical protein [Nocardia amamiensis]|uniref:hypothetical protein n=1 Tax=Nocardia amamiensis TaxID=404578 RepID=UPI0008302E67|nr:hypothetical protein [Nocardia amamiensis]
MRPILAADLLRYRDENELCAEINWCWAKAGYQLGREVDLAPGNRIDFFANFGIYHTGYRAYRLGIEVKVGGPQVDVARQLLRYADTGQLDCLLVITTDARHSLGWFPRPPGIPLFVLHLRAQHDRSKTTRRYASLPTGIRWGHVLPEPDR